MTGDFVMVVLRVFPKAVVLYKTSHYCLSIQKVWLVGYLFAIENFEDCHGFLHCSH